MTETSLPSDKMDAAAKHVFWASYFGWLLDGYDTTIYAFVLVGAQGALTFLLPNSGIHTSNPAAYGLMLFAIFLIGWGTAFVFGPLADKVGRMRMLGIAILLYAIGTFFSGLSYNIIEFGIARFIAGFGLGAEWFIGGTGVSEVFPEKTRHIWAGRFHSAWYAGFILAALTTPLLLAYVFLGSDGWRYIFFVGIIPAVILAYIRIKAKEPEVWKRKKEVQGDKMSLSMSYKVLFSNTYRKTTILMILVMVPVITGLYGGTLFAPTAITELVGTAVKSGVLASGTAATWYVVLGGTTISAFTLMFCLLMPYIVAKVGRKVTLTMFMVFMIVGLLLAFGLAFNSHSLFEFLPLLILLGIGGADFSVFSLWVPEIYPTEARAGGFALITALGRYAGAGLVFVISALTVATGSLGTSLAYGSIIFVVGIVLLMFVHEDRNKELDRSISKMALDTESQ
ncbi:MAG: MFS transporter [Candidatus Thermoplasmatota archaeon]|jgi:MFS family permease|nr:MFS transporter [Candidatus Thermoplasmatota archaeon]